MEYFLPLSILAMIISTFSFFIIDYKSSSKDDDLPPIDGKAEDSETGVIKLANNTPSANSEKKLNRSELIEIDHKFHRFPYQIIPLQK